MYNKQVVISGMHTYTQVTKYVHKDNQEKKKKTWIRKANKLTIF